ncbi:MAG: hypothetical protein WBG08_03150 [Litorimonas sp.]
MPHSITTRVLLSNCHTRSLTIAHLTRKLERLNDRTSRPDAKPYDYIQRDRVERQLLDAADYLC